MSSRELVQPMAALGFQAAALGKLSTVACGAAAAGLRACLPAAKHAAEAAAAAAVDDARRRAAREDEDRLCVVCMEAPCSVLLATCGHVVLCRKCCEDVRGANNQVRAVRGRSRGGEEGGDGGGGHVQVCGGRGGRREK